MQRVVKFWRQKSLQKINKAIKIHIHIHMPMSVTKTTTPMLQVKLKVNNLQSAKMNTVMGLLGQPPVEEWGKAQYVRPALIRRVRMEGPPTKNINIVRKHI